MMQGDFIRTADDFLKIASQFSLGELPTELPNPLTANLSALAKSDLPQAISILQEVDRLALRVISAKSNELSELSSTIADTLLKKGRIFICGCGATGRLALTLEFLWRNNAPDNLEAVIAFMAGGDTALVRSIENFEDNPPFAERQLIELGFSENDLLISSSEGGETPFVIAATEKAAALAKRAPYFLYCNPDEALSPIERSRRIINAPNIKKINLFCGPMAVSGSTRMQASTVLLDAIGLALFSANDKSNLREKVKELTNSLSSLDFKFLKDFIELESDIYNKGDYVIYRAPPELAISVLTDTTERSPTFSLLPFENKLDEQIELSLCSLMVEGTKSSSEAWQKILSRNPRALEWPKHRARVSLERLLGYDLSEHALLNRQKLVPTKAQHIFDLALKQGKITFSFDKLNYELPGTFSNSLELHLALKLLLNIHSTLIMGRLGRYEGNIMTWVRPSNNKLIDRSARYVRFLLEREGIVVPYDETVRALFAEMEVLKEGEPIVLKTFERLKKEH